MRAARLVLVWVAAAAFAAAQGRGRGGQHPYEPSETDPAPVVTHHQITVHGQTLNYTATVGRMPVPGAAGKTEAHIFFVAYTLDGQDAAKRPLSFLYNGGPGEPAIWVHMGGFGPRRIALNPDGTLPPAPYHLVDNQETFLPATDMVFIDPDGTGYSRAVSAEALAATSGVAGDMQSLGEFIRLYLTKYDRYASPLYLGGESYGTFRSAGLAGYLAQRGIAFNGIMLFSSILDMHTLDESPDNDQPDIFYLPSYAATAWYHHKLPPDLQKLTLPQVVAQAETWDTDHYIVDLEQGDALQGAARQQAIHDLARFTGLDPQLIDNYNLRISSDVFTTSLLRDQKEIVGGLDGRMTGFNRMPGQQRSDFDAAWVQRPVYTQMFTQYVRDELGYKTDDVYGGGIAGWNYNIYTDNMSSLLESAFAKNPSMKLLLATGYYDLNCPFWEAEYSMHHLFLPPAIQANITIKHYPVGHMLYQDTPSRQALAADVGRFIAASSASSSGGR